jgi:hypothetical protein
MLPMFGEDYRLSGPRASLPVTSPEFSHFALKELKSRWASVRDDERRFAAVLDEVEAERVYERWPVERPYGNLDALCVGELGVPLAEVRRTIADTAALRSVSAAERTTTEDVPSGQGERTDLANFAMLPRTVRGAQSGVSRETQRKIDYLARHRRDLHEQVKAGEIKVDPAYRQARDLPPKASVSLTVECLVEVIRNRLTPEQIAELVRLLEGEVG